MFRPEISLAMESADGQPKTTSECIKRAFRVEHRLNQIKEERAKAHEDRRRKYAGQTNINADQVQNERRNKKKRQ